MRAKFVGTFFFSVAALSELSKKLSLDCQCWRTFLSNDGLVEVYVLALSLLSKGQKSRGSGAMRHYS